jgi:hypothetical protein
LVETLAGWSLLGLVGPRRCLADGGGDNAAHYVGSSAIQKPFRRGERRWLELLLLIGIAVGVCGRPFWRFPQARVLDGLIGVTLFNLSTIAAAAFFGFACQVAIDC